MQRFIILTHCNCQCDLCEDYHYDPVSGNKNTHAAGPKTGTKASNFPKCKCSLCGDEHHAAPQEVVRL